MPNRSKKLQIVVEVDDKGSVKITKFGQAAEKAGERGEKGFKKMRGSLSDLNRTLQAVVATIGLIKVAQAVKSIALMTARYVTLGIVMKSVGKIAGYNAGQMAEYQKALEKTGIAMIESRHTLIRIDRKSVV